MLLFFRKSVRTVLLLRTFVNLATSTLLPPHAVVRVDVIFGEGQRVVVTCR